MAKITGIVKEKKSSRYFQAKNRNLINGVDEKLLKILRSSPDICSDPISETFIHLDEETSNFIPVYLKSEIIKLNHKDIYCDGTFSVVRNSEYSQIYIFSILYSNGGKGVFTYPVMFFLMKSKFKKNYVEILEFIKKLYRESQNSELEKNFHSDAELAFTQAVSECFPKSSMYLCSVHILRCFMKKFKSKVDTTFFKNPGLVKIWRILSGSIFLPLGQTEILNVLKLYLKMNLKLFQKLSSKISKIFEIFE